MNDDIIDAQIQALRAGSEKHWKHEMTEQGVRGAWPDLITEAGDEVAALRLMARSLGGAYVGRTIDPDTDRPEGQSAVLAGECSKLIVGPPKTGKSTRAIIPGLVQSIAAGMRGLLVTPQPRTIDDVVRTALAVGDSDTARILDFGGEVVEHGSSRLTTWDPTSRCGDPEAAREFARTLAGPGSPAADDLGKGNGAGFWLQIPEVAAAAAAHLTQVERDMKRQSALSRGMSPAEAGAASLRGAGRTGISGVFDYLRRPSPADPRREGTPFAGLSQSLRSELTPAQRNALRDQPARLDEMEEIVRTAAYNAASFPLPLQKLVYNRALLELQGAPVDLGLVGEELEELAPIVTNIAKRESDPLDQLGRAVRQAVPPNEQRILSPQPGDVEISPQQIVDGPSGLYVVSYDSAGGSTGLAPGWFCDEVLKASFRHSKQLEAERLLGGTDTFSGLSVWVDEGGALKYMDFDLALKEGRQHNIAVNASATSLEQLTDEIGEARANTIIRSAPITVNFAPTSAQAADISESFGKSKSTDVTHGYQSDSAGFTVSVSEHDAPRVPADRIKNLKPGEVIITDTSGAERRDNIVQTWAFYERNNPVGDTMASVDRAEGPDMPWNELLPEAQRRLDVKRAARQQLAAPTLPELPEERQPGALRRLADAVDAGAAGTPAPVEPPPPAQLPDPRRDLTDL